MEILIPLTVVQHFSVEIGFHMSKNMRLEILLVMELCFLHTLYDYSCSKV